MNDIENDLYDLILRLVRFPEPRICRHAVALDVLSILESRRLISEESVSTLADALVRSDDETALALLALRGIS